MSRRQDLERHRQGLEEIREIMNSMKTLAYMETRKLAQFLDAQRTSTRSVLEAAEDFLAFHPETLPEAQPGTDVYLLIGTERGFCGDFNPALLLRLNENLAERGVADPLLVALGHKLHLLLEGDSRVAAFIDGAGVVEEVGAVLGRLVEALGALQGQWGAFSLKVIHQIDNGGGVRVQELLPPFRHCLDLTPRFTHPPLLNLPPADFLSGLSEQYLISLLHEILYSSLMAENNRRLAHLEGAIRHLDQSAEELKHRCNALRQEEIIEEIEVILLSAGG
ncbi:MAG: F0F1 ATP synthase subunit gamma [Gammaproteobacteria bacterium]|nr:F0F1 ATP synthase subunit gamma [Gammaproteobacteria bacterium]MBU1653641.1 F0F1 ATP synthase subunit gamma [Gammaproteobacteria bacterium]MBU1962753.1 F0F1 ATP synthase subunit gamma [Gammaproteobacteria bacterium]